MQILDESTTIERLPFKALLDALERMFIEGCTVPLRHSHVIENSAAGAGTMLLMPAWQADRRFGIKTVGIYPGNRQRGLPGLHSTYLLFDASSGLPLAMLDGNVITSRRTAAASALAAKWLSRPDAGTLLVIGAGRVGRLLPHAFRAVREIRRVMVWNINSDGAIAMVRALRDEGIDAEHVTDLEAAVRQSDIVTCATLSTKPLVKGEWLRTGSHLDLIGGFAPAMRESDDECFRRARVFLDTPEALLKAGDVLDPIRHGAFAADQVVAYLEGLCRHLHPGRTSGLAGEAEITLFKAVGTALEDLAAACLAYEAEKLVA
jgi:ornithine cyclodeaminase